METCTCVAYSFLSANTTLTDVLANSTATNGKCDEACTGKLVAFVFGLFMFLFLIFVMKIPSIIITLRSGHYLTLLVVMNVRNISHGQSPYISSEWGEGGGGGATFML